MEKKIKTVRNHLSESYELWKTDDGYAMAEDVYNGTDTINFYYTKFKTLAEVNQFIINFWFTWS